jgi:hypothetical protein
MYIVMNGREKHSAWDTKSGACHQVEVLINHGYREGALHIIFVQGADYTNGHYFV